MPDVSADLPRTGRGFRLFHDALDRHGRSISVVESSLAFQGPHVRIYHGGDEHVQMDVATAEAVAAALLAFVEEARADALTEPMTAV